MPAPRADESGTSGEQIARAEAPVDVVARTVQRSAGDPHPVVREMEGIVYDNPRGLGSEASARLAFASMEQLHRESERLRDEADRMRLDKDRLLSDLADLRVENARLAERITGKTQRARIGQAVNTLGLVAVGIGIEFLDTPTAAAGWGLIVAGVLCVILAWLITG